MYFYLKTYKDGLYEGQELSDEHFIFEPKKGLKMTIHKEGLDSKGEGSLAFEIEIVDFDEKGISYRQYDQENEEYGDVERIEISETKECEIKYIIYTYKKCYSDIEVYLYLDTLDYFLDVSRYIPIEVYEDLFTKAPEYKEKVLPRLLKEGTFSSLQKIYREGLFGIEKDELRAFSYQLFERDYDEFLRWYHSPKVEEDIKLMKNKFPVYDLFDMTCEAEYWLFRYQCDHLNIDCIKTAERLLKFILRDGYTERDCYTYYLTSRDIVKFIVNNNAYAEFESLELDIENNEDYEPATVWMIYAIYLAMNESYKREGKRIYPVLYGPAPEEIFELRYRISWATPKEYINKETALHYVKKAAKESDTYAISLLNHYKIEY